MKKDIVWIEYLRAVACLMVIILHLSANYLYSSSPQRYSWHAFNIINAAMRGCVPLFFMISGYIFIKITDISFRHFYRLGLCIIFYSVTCTIFLVWYKSYNSVTEMKRALFSPVIYHLWFFYALIPCYFFFLLYGGKKSSCSEISVKRFAVFLIAVFLLFTYNSDDQLKIMNISNPVTYKLNSEIALYIIYALIGSELGEWNTKKIKNWQLITLFLVSVLFIFVGTQILSERKGWLDSTFYNYNTLLVSFSSIATFIFIKNNENLISGRVKEILIKIGSLSLPIYGLHAILIVYFKDRILVNNNGLDFIIKLSIVILFSYFISTVLKRLDKKSYIT